MWHIMHVILCDQLIKFLFQSEAAKISTCAQEKNAVDNS